MGFALSASKEWIVRTRGMAYAVALLHDNGLRWYGL